MYMEWLDSPHFFFSRGFASDGQCFYVDIGAHLESLLAIPSILLHLRKIYRRRLASLDTNVENSYSVEGKSSPEG